mmetsp:Transcript_29144/g.67075  ORF Transcript_29144/g.67075 Transcript_29144/m.67075 type:complete len:258 (+) Transcript_29144:579-1352(+)
MLVCGCINDGNQQCLSCLMLMLRDSLHQDFLDDIIAKLVVDQVGCAWDDFLNQGSSHLATPAIRVAMSNQAQANAAAKAMPGQPHALAGKLVRNEASIVRRNRLDNLLDHVVGMRVLYGSVHVSMQALQKGLQVILCISCGILIAGGLSLLKRPDSHLHGLLHNCARLRVLAGHGPDLTSAAFRVGTRRFVDQLPCPVVRNLWRTTTSLTSQPGLAILANIPAVALCNRISRYLAVGIALSCCLGHLSGCRCGIALL